MLHPFGNKQQLLSSDPIIATNLQVALSRPEISHDFLGAVRLKFRKWKHDVPLGSQATTKLETRLNAELISFFELEWQSKHFKKTNPSPLHKRLIPFNVQKIKRSELSTLFMASTN